jgi:hypothetical protein
MAWAALKMIKRIVPVEDARRRIKRTIRPMIRNKILKIKCQPWMMIGNIQMKDSRIKKTLTNLMISEKINQKGRVVVKRKGEAKKIDQDQGNQSLRLLDIWRYKKRR